MTKAQTVQEFLKGKTFTTAQAAFNSFKGECPIDVNFYYFQNIYKNAGGIENPDAPAVEEVQEEIEYTKVEEIDFPDSILVPFKSDLPVDKMISVEGGVLPATITIAPGTSGVGKSTVLLALLGAIKKKNPKTRLLFISTEMNKIHLFKYKKRAKFEGVEILLLGEYENPKAALERSLRQGWDVALIDSLQDCIDKIVATSDMKGGRAESWVLRLMDETRLAKNERKLYTAYICTQHMTKSAVYAGSTKVKHMTDAMMEFLFDETGNSYIEYSKNRDGAIRKKMYYTLSDTGVEFNQERFERDEKVRATIAYEFGARKIEEESFDAVIAGIAEAEKNTNPTVELNQN